MSEPATWSTPKLIVLGAGVDDAQLGGPAPNATDGVQDVYVS